ncbi:hypothetical protein JEQ17_18375 [Streptomyces liliifuscus]|uniref:Uncharacterized protein n=2 Tax=Streptomyces liliifuscus TaxID=2797636 RepID=A0A7T7I567_9ACTN|nr:hypothetical protein JEQ17_18375 [Streptomyces liliifuscus]
MRRLLAVHFVPCALFVTCLGGLLRAGSFSGRANWSAVLPSNPAATVGALLLIGVCAAVLGMLLQPFQVRAVRVLEGYWDRWPVTAGMAGVLMEFQRRRGQTLADRADAAADAGPDAQRVAADASRRLAAAPPAHALLPTALGNALRAGELSAGERYGLTTLSSWPRIYPQVSAPLAQALSSARDMLDTAVNLCHAFLVCAGVMMAAFYDEPDEWWLVALALVLAAVAYKGAVVAAQAYAGLMHVVYDLHRFDLVDALHHPLPDRDGEWALFQRLSDRFAGRRVNLPYVHGSSRPDETDGPDQPEKV